MLARSRVLLGSLLVAAVSSSSLSPVLAQTPPPASGAPANPIAPAPPPATAPATAPTAPATPPAATAPAPTAPAPTATVPAPAATAPAVVSSSWPMVTFAPDRPQGSLQRFDKHTEGGDSWTTVCEGPCSKNLDVRHGYRVGGEGVMPSPWFKLPKSEEPFSLKAETGSKSTRTVGQVLAWASPVFGVVGATLLATGDNREAWDGRTYAGGALLVGGVALLVTGLALIGSSSTTTSLERAAPPQNARRTRPDASF
jgi:hypothetical protein